MVANAGYGGNVWVCGPFTLIVKRAWTGLEGLGLLGILCGTRGVISHSVEGLARSGPLLRLLMKDDDVMTH